MSFTYIKQSRHASLASRGNNLCALLFQDYQVLKVQNHRAQMRGMQGTPHLPADPQKPSTQVKKNTQTSLNELKLDVDFNHYTFKNVIYAS